ncbi:aquaporin-11 [Discoglossus pictus]
MEPVWAFMLVVAAIVLLCEALRAVLEGGLRAGLKQELLVELVSTFQLCACIQEMVIMNVFGGLNQQTSLGLTFIFTIIHSNTARAMCNPCGALDMWLRNQASVMDTALRLVAQYSGAVLSLLVMPAVWSLGLSKLHKGPRCTNPLTVSPMYGAGVEMLCTLGLFIMLRNLNKLRLEYRIYAIALGITATVYLGGPLTGAVFNPVLAFVTVFHCVGNIPQYLIVYCLGPLVGMLVSILLFDRGIPKLESSLPRLAASGDLKKFD